PVLKLDPRVLGDVVVPDRVLRCPAQRRDNGVLAVVLDPHQRSFAELAGLGADGGQQNDRLALHICGVGSTGFGVLVSLFARPVPRAGRVFTFEWHETTIDTRALGCPAARVAPQLRLRVRTVESAIDSAHDYL